MKSKFFFSYLFIIFLFINCSSNQSTGQSENEKKAEIFYTYGTQSLVQKNYTDALDNLLKSYDLNPNDSKLNNNLGMAYFFKDRSDKAIDHLNKAIEIDKKNSDAKSNLASIYYNLGEYQKAKKLFHEVLEDLVYQHHYRILHGLALISIKDKKYSEAKDYLEKSIKENTDYCPAYFTLGKLELSKGQHNEAIDNFKKANKGTCFSEEAPLIALAQTYYNIGDFDRAKLKFLEYIERFPSGSFVKEAQKNVSEITDQDNTKDHIRQKQSAPLRKSPNTDNREELDEINSDPNF